MFAATKLFAPLAVVVIIAGGLRAEDEKKDEPKRGYLGIKIRASQEGEKGIVIEEVIEDAPASKGGLKVEDVILKVNGQDVSELQTFVEIVRATKPGDQLTLTIKRGDKEMELKIKAGTAPVMN